MYIITFLPNRVILNSSIGIVLNSSSSFKNAVRSLDEMSLFTRIVVIREFEDEIACLEVYEYYKQHQECVDLSFVHYRKRFV